MDQAPDTKPSVEVLARIVDAISFWYALTCVTGAFSISFVLLFHLSGTGWLANAAFLCFLASFLSYNAYVSRRECLMNKAKKVP